MNITGYPIGDKLLVVGVEWSSRSLKNLVAIKVAFMMTSNPVRFDWRSQKLRYQLTI